MFKPLLLSGACLFVATTAFAVDCNLNGVDDSVDLSSRASLDCNANAVPDDCEFRAQGASFAAPINVPLKTISTSGNGSETLSPRGALDLNGDGALDLWGTHGSYGTDTEAAIYVYLNNGDNTFADPYIERLGTATQETLIDVGVTPPGDLDGDGKLELLYSRVAYSHSGDSTLYDHSMGLIEYNAGSFTRQNVNIASLLNFEHSGYSGVATVRYPGQTSTDLAYLTGEKLYIVRACVGWSFCKVAEFETPEGFALAQYSTPTGDFLGVYGRQGLLFGFRSLPERTVIAADISRTAFPRSYPFYPTKLVTDERLQAPLQVTTQQVSYPLSSSVPFRRTVNRFSISVPPASARAELFIPDEYSYPLAVSDLDGNGVPELLFGGRNQSYIVVDPAHASPDHLLSYSPPVSGAWIAEVADFNRDGKDDLLYNLLPEPKSIIVLSTTSSFSPATLIDRDLSGIADQCERATPLDFDGDKRSDVVAIRRGERTLAWYIAPTSQLSDDVVPQGIALGAPGDTPLAGDFNGDGAFEPGVVSNRSVLRWKTATETVAFGRRGDLPFGGYFDSDRREDRAVVRNVRGRYFWYIRRSLPQDILTLEWGSTGDIPVVGDIDGDGIDEVIFARPYQGSMIWFPRKISGAILPAIAWGLSSDIVMPPSDTDGDGKDEVAVARVENGSARMLVRDTWYGSAYGAPPASFYTGRFTGLTFDEGAIREELTGELKSCHRLGIMGEYRPNSSACLGLAGDMIIGGDGKVPARLGMRGALSCTSIESPTDGAGGFHWSPRGVRQSLGLPSLVLPSAINQISRVDLFNIYGQPVDRMRKLSRSTYSANWSADYLNALFEGGRGPTIQVSRRNGRRVCYALPSAVIEVD